MNRFLLGVVGLAVIGIAAPAVAADLPAQTYSKAPPVMIPAAYDWSGVYVGANGGWGTANRCFDLITATGGFVSDGCHTTSGGVVGGQIGYRLQTGSFVYGLEFQGDWANMHGSGIGISNTANTNRSRIDAFGLFTGQLGYAFNTALLYLKGGAAVVADRNDILVGGVVVATAAGDNRWGGTIGGGVEFSFAPNWSAGIEYDHLFITNNNTTFTAVNGSTFTTSTDRVRGDADMVTVRVNYRWGGPVVAKY